MSEYLFAYGTLQPDHAAEEIAPVVAKFRPVGKGHVRGRLYDLGEYPGAILSSSSRSRISGTVFRLPDDPAVLRKLDDYEGFDPHDSVASLFVRRIHPVVMSQGRRLPCWVYVYNGKPEASRLVSGGSFRKRGVKSARSGRTRSPRATVANK